MLIQRRTDLLISHSEILRTLLFIVHREPLISKEGKCFSGSRLARLRLEPVRHPLGE
jgi:hypothetical protein